MTGGLVKTIELKEGFPSEEEMEQKAGSDSAEEAGYNPDYKAHVP